jgi:hypothetical protein
MVFALDTDDHSLMVFPNEADAIAYCEGIDVEEGGWLFFGNDGTPLEPQFSRPNQRGSFVVTSGKYTLQPAAPGAHPSLCERLHEISSVEGIPGISSVLDVERLLTTGSKGDASKATRA